MKPRSKSPAGKTRWECRTRDSYCYSTTSPETTPRKGNGNTGPSNRRTVFKRKLDEDAKVYIITCAQNGTPVHDVFWDCLKTMAKHRDAELLVVPIRYKNPTSRWSASQANEEYWVEDVRPYLWNQRKVLNQNLVLIGESKTQPTAANPLDRYEAVTGSSSAIIGHPKMELKSVPTPGNRMPKVLSTTGACTVPNYTDSKAGKIGQFHHTLSAIVVEIVGKRFFLRQLNFDTKTQSFTDLDTRYCHDRVEKAPPALALIMGDTHTDFISEEVEEATFGAGGIVETLKPERLVWHDLLDAYSVNPHHKGNVFNSIAKMVSGLSNVGGEVERACHYVKDHTPPGTTSVIVPSNHNDFLRRWIISNDWRTDPANAKFYLATALQMVTETRFERGFGTRYPSPLPMLFPQIVDTSNIDLLVGKKSYTVANIELIMHGDRGPNGSRGSIKNHRNLGVRSIIGHCLTSDHDVLVEGRGWVPIAEATTASRLMSWDPSSGRNCWGRATEKQAYKYSGRLVRIHHTGVFDQEVTPNHRLMLKTGATPTVCEAVMTEDPKELPVTALCLEDGKLEVDEQVLRRVVAVAADGGFYHRSLTFHLKKDRKRQRLEMLFGDDLRPERPCEDTGTFKRTVIMDSPAYNSVLDWICPETAEKRLPMKFLELTPRCRDIVLDELQHWDGTFVTDKRNGRQYSTYKESEAQLISALCTMQGYRCTLSKRPDSPGWIVSWCVNRDHTYVSDQNHDKARWGQWGATTREVVDEPVWCFTVESTGCFWVRSRKTGLISLTHNSHSPGILEGCWQVGTSTALDLEYTEGAPSSWLNAHCTINADGKRQLLIIVDGKFRA